MNGTKSLESYCRLSRSHTYSLLLAIPLLLIYEVLVSTMNRFRVGEAQVRNMAEVMLQSLLVNFGVRGPMAFVGLLILIAVFIIVHERRSHPDDGAWPPRRWVLAGMLAESLAWALVFGVVVSYFTAMLLSPLAAGQSPVMMPAADSLSRVEGIVLSFGAGLYEELLFRVILVGAIAWPLSKLETFEGLRAPLLAALISAFLFSAIHHLGDFADTFSVSTFLYRFVGGLAFSLIYVLRGFGIVAWTHALYDLCIFLFAPPGG